MWRVKTQLTNNRYLDEWKNSVERPQKSKNFKIAVQRAINESCGDQKYIKY